MVRRLHRGAFKCPEELVQNIETEKDIDFCMERIHMLKQHNIIPIVVFDGAQLPMKGLTEDKRSK